MEFLIIFILGLILVKSSKPTEVKVRETAKRPINKTYSRGEFFKLDGDVYYNCYDRGIVRVK